jgi:hypothetical protein
MTAPTTESRKPAGRSSVEPSARDKNPPKKDPRTPTMSDVPHPPGSRPGTSKRETAPTMSPNNRNINRCMKSGLTFEYGGVLRAAVDLDEGSRPHPRGKKHMHEPPRAQPAITQDGVAV